MERKFYPSKFKVFCLIIGLIFTLSPIFSTSSQAQIKGTIVGRVIDSATGNYLPGANVMLKGTTLGAATNREGAFRIVNVPPGTYTLWVNYIGYEDYTTQVKVTGGQQVNLQDIALKVSAVQAKAIVVEGLREGQMKALSQQRSALNIKNVVAQEQIERFPDENTADVLKRIPGIYISNSLGEGRYALIRGTDPRLNMVTVNGEKLATNRTEERFSQLDIIGSSQLATVEVVKAITPDMDGNAIGGSINLVTRSAFDYAGRRVDVRLGSGYTNLGGKPIGEGKINYSNLFGANRNFGISFTANWDQKTRDIHNSEPRWQDEEDVNGNEIPFALKEVTLMDYRSKFARYGIGGGLEYRLNSNHRWYVRGLFSQFNEDQLRGEMRLRVDKGDYLNAMGTLTHKSRIALKHKWRLEKLVQQQFSAGGLNKFGDKQLDYTVAYSFADETHKPQYQSEWNFDEKVDLSLDLARPEAPKWTIMNIDEATQYDPSHYTIDNIDYRNTYSSDKLVTSAANFKMPYSLAGFPAEMKIGVKARFEKKDRDEDRWKYKWKGDEDVLLAQVVSDRKLTNFFDGEYARFAPIADQGKVEKFFNANKGGLLVGKLRYWDSEGQNYVANEGVYAYYTMTTVHFGNLMFLGGFRHEFTQNNYKGTQLYFDEHGDFSSMDRVTAKRNYNNFLPMAHLRYQFGPMTNLRFAYTQAIARPNFWDLAPYFFVDPDHEEIVTGNPDLKPTTSRNLDLMFEHYFRGIGIASAGFFYKNLNDIIYVQTSKVVGGVYDDFDKEQAINGGSANLSGFEINWQQELSFLPGFLSGFGIYANYTHTWSDANLLGREGFLPGQAGDVGNISLSYDKHGFSARISANYRDKFITQVGRDKDRDEWTDKHLQVDFSATYDVTPWIKAYVQAINLTNEPKYEYLGIHNRPLVVQYYSWWMKAGLKFRFGQ